MRKSSFIFLAIAMLSIAGALGLTTRVILAQPPTIKTVSIKNLAYDPQTITVKVGESVVWRNEETLPISHTTTSGTCTPTVCTPQPGWDSGILNPGDAFTQTFNTVGTFTYFCRIHGPMMQGTVHVVAEGTVTPTTTTATATASATSSATVARTATPNATATNPASPTATLTSGPSLTGTPAKSATATSTATATRPVTQTMTPSPTVTPIPTTGATSDSTGWIVAGTLAIILVGAGGWWLFKQSK